MSHYYYYLFFTAFS